MVTVPNVSGIIIVDLCPNLEWCPYRKDIEHLYHAFVYSPVSLLSGIYPLPAMHSLLATLYPDFDWLR